MKRKRDSGLVTIDAGGTLFKTWRSTLMNSVNYFPGSIFPDLFTEERDVEEPYFLDTDGELFRHILQLIRRPALSTGETPHNISPLVWHQELDFWGLKDKVISQEVQVAETQKREYNRNLASLERLGDEIRTRIKDNEVSAIRAILDGSGYSGEADKTRSKKIRLPIGGHKMACGTDLGSYVKSNASSLAPLMTRVLGQGTTVSIGKDLATKHFLQYEFGEKSYSTKDTETLVIDIVFTQL
jgi:hypothetical protein